MKKIEIANLFTELAFALKAGNSIQQAIASIAYLASPSTKQRCQEIVYKLKEGISLSQALAVYSDITVTECRLIATAANQGHMAELLLALGQFREQQIHLKSTVITAIIYPITVLLAALIALFCIKISLIPILDSYFGEQSVTLPWLTLATIYFCKNLMTPLFVTFFLLFCSTTIAFISNNTCKKIILSFLARLPLIKNYSRMYQATQYLSFFTMLTEQRVGLFQVLRICRSTINNPKSLHDLDTLENSLHEGTAMSSAFSGAHQKASILSRSHVAALSFAFEQGTILETSKRCMQQQRNQLTQTTEGIIRSLSPILLIICGGVVLVITYSLLIPFMNSTGILF